jgi:hypothetical protein
MQIESLQAEINNLESAGYHQHHAAWAKGYFCRREFEKSPYQGKFGEGFILDVPSWETTRYHRVMYFIKKEEHNEN